MNSLNLSKWALLSPALLAIVTSQCWAQVPCSSRSSVGPQSRVQIESESDLGKALGEDSASAGILATPEVVLQSTPGAVNTMAFSPDGHLLASGGSSSTLVIWDVTKQRIVCRLGGEGGQIKSLVFTPDGRYVAVAIKATDLGTLSTTTGLMAPRGNELRMFDIVTGQLVWHRPYSREPLAVAISGNFLASAGFDKKVRLWDVPTGQPLPSFDAGVRGALYCVAFSPDGRLIAAAGLSKRIYIWDTSTRRRIQILRGHEGDIKSIAFSGRWLISGSCDKTIKVWDIVTWREVRSLRAASCVDSVAASPDVRWVASGESGGRQKFGKIRVWAPESKGKQLLHTFDAPGWGTEIVAFDPSSGILASGDPDGAIRLWDFANEKVLHRFGGHGDLVTGLAISPDERWLASAGTAAVHIWNISEEIKTTHLTSGAWGALQFSSDGKWLASGTWDTTVALWPVSTWQMAKQLSGHSTQIRALAFSPESTRLASGGVDGTIKLWDLSKGGKPETFRRHVGVDSLAFSADGRLLASSGGWSWGWPVSILDTSIRIWDVQTGHQIHSLDIPSLGSRLLKIPKTNLTLWPGRPFFLPASSRQHCDVGYQTGAHQDVAFSPDGRWLARSVCNTIQIWDVSTWQESYRFTSPGIQWTKIAWDRGESGDRKSHWLAAGTTVGTIEFWAITAEKATEKPLLTLSGHAGAVSGLSLTENNGWLISSSYDGTVELWALTSPGNATTFPKSGERMVTLFSGTDVISGSDDWLVVAPDGLFDGSPEAMNDVAWRNPQTNGVSSLSAFYNDFYHPGLLAEIIASRHPKAQVDIATAVQVPALRIMMAEDMAHIEERDSRVLVCFAQEPGVAVNVSPCDRRDVVPPINGYGVNREDPTCKFWKELSLDRTNSAAVMEQLNNWKQEVITTPWDGQQSDTSRSTLHVLTVGISLYPEDSGFVQVPDAVPSAEEIERFFREQQVSPKKPYAAVRVWDGLYDKGAKRENLLQRFSEMAKEVGEDDVVLLYLAGHGKVPVGEEMFYFVPMDGRDSDLPHTGVSTAIIAEALRNMPARRIVLIVDACQSGGAIEALSKIAVVKAQVEQRRAQQGNKVRGQEHGVGIHLIAAALPLSYANDPSEGRSVLAETLLKALQQQAGTITIDQLSAFIKNQLPTISEQVTHGCRQAPLVDSIGLDFPIAAR